MHAIGWGRYTSFPEVPDRRYRCHRETWLSVVDQVSTNDFIEVTSLHYLRWIRHGNREFMNAYEHLNNPHHFERVATFDRSFLNRHFYGKLDPMFRSYFISPTIKIYRRRPPGPDRIDAPAAGAPAPEPHP